LSDRSEQDDLARSLDGDGQAYARIVARHQASLARRMRLFDPQPGVVEELVQEVFVEAYYSLSGYRGEGEFAAWLSRIATRVGYRHWKKNRRNKEVVRDESWWSELGQQNIGQGDVEQLDPTAASQLVHDLLERLPPRDRLVLLLTVVEGHSVDEAARLAGWSKTMVKVQAFRARRRLRQMLAELGIESVQGALDSHGVPPGN
jgi:RNA polymerase sigma-70 factor, ECF subfamily